MTYEDFMTHIEDYYGPYREGTKSGSYVLRYLRAQIDQNKLKSLFDTVCLYHSLSDYAPGIADIEKSIKLSARENKSADFYIKRTTGEAQRIQQHKEQVLSLPDEERIEFDNDYGLWGRFQKEGFIGGKK